MPIWIQDPVELSRHLQSAAPARVGVDTEFVRERTYWPQLALVQVSIEQADGVEIYLVDPLVPGMGAALAALLRDRSVLKVMHSAGEDLIALTRGCGAVPEPLFDTQIAAALAGVGAGMGYQKLVQTLLDVHVDKGETRSDWLRRPLSPAQLDYAAADVEHLFALHDLLAAQLQVLGRDTWLQQDCSRMLDSANDSDAERWPHLGMRAAQYLDAPAQHRLLRLLRWREVQARAGDLPRSWVLDNELSVALARSPPPDQAELMLKLAASPKSPRRLAGSLWLALQTPLWDEKDAPLARSIEGSDKVLMRSLQDAVTAHSARLRLPEGVLAPRRALESLIDPACDGNWPRSLNGWRREQLEPLLSPLLRAGEPPAPPV